MEAVVLHPQQTICALQREELLYTEVKLLHILLGVVVEWPCWQGVAARTVSAKGGSFNYFREITYFLSRHRGG